MTDLNLSELDRFIVTGASGWLGRSTLEVLASWLPHDAMRTRVTAFGSQSRTIRLQNGVSVDILKLDPASVKAAPGLRTWLVHLAFLTRDRALNMPRSEYVSVNASLISAGLQIARRAEVSGVVLVSSGAAVGAHDGPADDVRANPYGFMKLVEQSAFAEVAEREQFPVVVSRLWGASGGDVADPAKYALGSFVLQALRNRSIELTSDHEVWRRYVPSRQLMELCLRLVLANRPLVFDSGGPLVEIADLARLVARQVGADVTVFSNSTRSGLPDRWFSSDSGMEVLMTSVGMRTEALPDQIASTIDGLRLRIARGELPS